LCCRKGIAQNLYYRWSKDFLESDKKRLSGDTVREANSSEVQEFKGENAPVRLHRWKYIVTGHDLAHDTPPPPWFNGREPAILESSVPGIFFAGDVWSGITKQVLRAARKGAAAALMIGDYFKDCLEVGFERT
jgi:hypothetical protein